MIISTIVAKAKNNVIGKDNDIPWYLPADLKYFKKITTGHHILMGRKCFQSIGKPLPKRTNVIITQNPFFLVSNCYIANSVEESLQIAHDNGEEEAMIIGGGQIYELTKHLWDRMYITEVDAEIDGDIYFPTMDMNNWDLTSRKDNKKNEKNEFDYSFLVYDKNKNMS